MVSGVLILSAHERPGCPRPQSLIDSADRAPIPGGSDAARSTAPARQPASRVRFPLRRTPPKPVNRHRGRRPRSSTWGKTVHRIDRHAAVHAGVDSLPQSDEQWDRSVIHDTIIAVPDPHQRTTCHVKQTKTAGRRTRRNPRIAVDSALSRDEHDLSGDTTDRPFPHSSSAKAP